MTCGGPLTKTAMCSTFWCRNARDKRAAKRFFLKLLKGLCYVPRLIVTDKLGSYGAARREIFPSVRHVQEVLELSHDSRHCWFRPGALCLNPV